MPRKGNKRRKTRTHVKEEGSSTGGKSAPASSKTPKSFVIHAGQVGNAVSQLAIDMRKVLEPNTATRLRERKSNRLRDFVSMSGPLGVSHMLVFSQPDPDTVPDQEDDQDGETLLNSTTCNFRFIRLPRGPTLSFKVLRYSLCADILRTARRPRAVGREFLDAPLLILSEFNEEQYGKQVGLMKTVWQNLFPPIHVQTMPLSSARRVVLLSYDPVRKTVDFRHFLISVRQVGVSKPIKKLLTGTTSSNAITNGNHSSRKRSASDVSDSEDVDNANEEEDGATTTTTKRKKGLLDLSRASDISDYVLKRHESGFMSDSSQGSSAGSDSEMSSDEGGGGHSSADERKGKVRLAGSYVGRGNRGKHVEGEKRAVKLEELGPRMELGLVKVEEGVAEGSVLFHEIVHKSMKEAAQLEQVHRQRRKEKEQRRKEQEENVKRKKAELDKGKGKVDDGPEEGDGDIADEESSEDELESGAENYDYDAEHGLQVGSSDEDEEEEETPFGGNLDDEVGVTSDEDVDDDDDDDDEEEEEEDEEMVDEQYSDDSDMSPIPFEPTPSPSPPPLSRPTKPQAQQSKKKKSALSFSHKGFSKFEAKPRKVIGVAPERVTKKEFKEKQKKEKEQEENERRSGTSSGQRGGRGGGRGGGARGGSAGRGSSRGRGGSRPSSRGQRRS